MLNDYLAKCFVYIIWLMAYSKSNQNKLFVNSLALRIKLLHNTARVISTGHGSTECYVGIRFWGESVIE